MIYNKRKEEEDYEPVRIDGVKCLKATAKAILVAVDGRELWIPQSQIKDDSEVYQEEDEGALVIPRWLAEERGLT